MRLGYRGQAPDLLSPGIALKGPSMTRNLAATTLLVAVALAFVPRPASGQQTDVSISFFYEQLAPQGRWVVAADYGDVWVPGGVPGGWMPYVDGHWVYSDYGWTWLSDDSWGPIAYHYGTWTFVAPYGWVWVPGLVWAPAWVTWAYSDEFIGWAPVPVSFDLTVSGYTGSPVVVSQTSYVFVPATRFSGVQVSSVRVPQDRNPTILSRAQKATQFSVAGGFVHNTGLPVAHVEKVSGKKIVSASVPARVRPATIAQAPAGSRGRGKVSVIAPATERSAAIKSKAGPERKERPESRLPGSLETRTTPGRPEAAGPSETMERRTPPPPPRGEAEKPGQEKKEAERTPSRKQITPRPSPKPEERRER